jgi:hypothetical protein
MAFFKNEKMIQCSSYKFLKTVNPLCVNLSIVVNMLYIMLCSCTVIAYTLHISVVR